MNIKYLLIALCVYLLVLPIKAQQITGYWQGKIGNGVKNKKVELKLIAKGDSLVGTSYYYESKNNYRRYSVKGYFNQKTNAVVWWDDILIDSKQPKMKVFSINELPFLVEADFNCPGGGIMMLDGKAKPLENAKSNDAIHLDKKENPTFDDEWNLVIDNWTVGGNNLDLIDSIQGIAFSKPELEKVTPITETPPIVYKTETNGKAEVVTLEIPVKKSSPDISTEQPKEKNKGEVVITKDQKANNPIEFLDISKPSKNVIASSTKEIPKETKATDTLQKTISSIATNEIVKNKTENKKPETIEIENKSEPKKPVAFLQVEKPKKEPITLDSFVNTKQLVPPTASIINKFVERKKIITTEIPIADSIEMHFYDNAEVDGDSISLFLDNKLIFEHIKLTDRPYIVKLSKEQLSSANELTMVAENLGAIPPNTSYMVAFVNGKQYTATLSSTEQSSAVIRFKKQ